MESTLKFQRGDIYFIRLDSGTGSEQSGTRPAVILQNDVGNTYSPTLIVATLTSKTEKKAAQPTHCLVEPEKLEPSIVQAEQIFTIDKSRVQNFVGHLTPEEMSRVDDAVRISFALNPMGSIQKLKPIIRSTAAYAPPEAVDGKPPVYPYTPIKSDFEDAGTVEEMMLYTELQSAVHAMIQRLEYSFTFNPSLLTSPKRKKQVAEILTEAEKYIWRIKEEILNDEKIPSPTAYKQSHGIHYHIAAKNPNADLWSSPTVYQMLHNQLYVGDMVQGRHKKVSYKSEKTIWLPQSQWIVVENTHEAIIDRDTFETVQMMMAGRARSNGNGTIHPLAGKMICGCCGNKLEQAGRRSNVNGSRVRYVRCRMHQRAPEQCSNKTCTNLDDLQVLVLERIRAYVADYFDPEKVTIPEQDDPIQQREQAKRDELKRLKSEVDRRRKAMQELYLDKVSGLIDTVQFSEMNQTFLEEVKKAETRINALEAELEQQQEETSVVQTQMQRVRELAQVSHLTRELVVLLVHRVVVGTKDPLTGEQKITIEWNF